MTMSVTELDARGCPTTQEPAADIADIVDPAPFVRRKGDGLARLELLVRGARCAGCLGKIEQGLMKLPGMREARLNLSTGKLAVAWDDGALAPIEITRTVVRLGYQAAPFDPAAAVKATDDEGRFLLRCLAVAAFATMNIMLLSVAVWAGHDGEMGEGTRGLFHLISGVIAIPAALYAGRPFFRSAFAALKSGRTNMDVPISLGVLLALSISIYETLQLGHHAYFDAAVMLLTFLLIGRYLDHRLRARARQAAQDLLALQATTANRVGADGSVVAVAARDINPGDRLLLTPGDRAPVNGTIEDGISDVDVSLVTGESAPVTMGPGETIHAGVLNVSQRMVMRATARVEDSLVADLTRLVEAGEQGKSRFVRMADKAASLYVPVVHTLALATFLGWYFVGEAGFRIALTNAVALLIITCPCALGLAAPAVQVVATGRLFRSGVLVKSGDALERLALARAMVFDKTGTLTFGMARLKNAGEVPAEALEAAAELARVSRHPLARALARHVGPGPVAADIEEMPGQGLVGTVRGKPARLGRREHVGIEAGHGTSGATEMWLRLGDEPPVQFLFEDDLREDAPEAVAALRARGMSVHMLSGDRQAPAERLARAAGITDWRAELQPKDKIAAIEGLRAGGMKVAMVGDGLNDTPALAAADVSFSPGTAADASQAASDYVIQGTKLAPIVEAVDVARAARQRMLENFAFAALYNMCAVPLAAAGEVTPLIAAIAMSGSSILVTLNALRLSRRAKPGGGSAPMPHLRPQAAE